MQYEIFRDLLIIVVAATAVFCAVIGALVFFTLRALLIRDITAEALKQVDKQCRKIRATALLQLGVVYWMIPMHNTLDKAIEVTERALDEFEDIMEEDELVFAKSNLGFYYAEKHSKGTPLWDRKAEAIALTRVGFEKYSPTASKFRKPDWVDNYVFAKAMFIQTNSEKDEVIKLANEMLGRADLQSVHVYLEESRSHASGLTLAA